MQGEYGTARALFAESLAIRRELGDRVSVAASLRDLGRVACQQREYGAARALFEESLAIKRELGNRSGIAASLYHLGLVACRQGDEEAARSLQEESLAIRRELGDGPGIAASLEAVAALVCRAQPGGGEAAAPGGRSQESEATGPASMGWRAARLFGAAEALRETIGVPLPPREQEAYRLATSRLREVLPEAAFAAAWAEGRALPLDQAIAEALGESGNRSQ